MVLCCILMCIFKLCAYSKALHLRVLSTNGDYACERVIWNDTCQLTGVCFQGKEMSTRKGQVTLDAPLDHIPLHVRGGHIIPTQEPANNTAFR